jgi:Fe-S-cluster containining protein
MKSKGDVVRIGMNDLCPCGSRKRFKDCCEGKGHAYGYFEYEGRGFAYDLDETNTKVDEIRHFTYDHIVTFWNNRTMIDRDRALEILETVYRLTDKILEPFLRNSSCKKGCHECCHLLVQIHAIEAEMIRTYVRENFDPKSISDLRAKIRKASRYYPDPIPIGPAYPDEVRGRYFNLHIPCPFLSTEGLCTVYEARPLIARTHMVFSHPSLCASYDESVPMYEGDCFPEIFTAIELLSRLVYQDVDYMKHVPHWFLDEFPF